ncbi:MAG TPA: N-terminal phage integrase SAM-like domain-containing protein, partial [Chloroflexota bacterium]|nr:N-terminal phage integrase SAM-like domain-containing protein [Chloroflexota bacterium]
MPNRRNPSGMGSFRQRHATLWEGRIVLPDGRRLSVYGKTEREAKRKARELREDAERGLSAGSGTVTVKAYMEQWIEDVHDQGRIRPGTLRAYSGHVRNHIVPQLGSIRLRNLNSHHVNTMLSKITK